MYKILWISWYAFDPRKLIHKFSSKFYLLAKISSKWTKTSRDISDYLSILLTNGERVEGISCFSKAAQKFCSAWPLIVVDTYDNPLITSESQQHCALSLISLACIHHKTTWLKRLILIVYSPSHLCDVHIMTSPTR